MEDIQHTPAFSLDDAVSIAREHFGIVGTASELPSERDQNFKIETAEGRFVLKAANPQTDAAMVELETAAIQIADAIGSFESPRLIRTLANAAMVKLRDPQGQDCWVRLITFLQGQTLASLTSLPQNTCFEFGAALAQLDLGLQNLNHVAAARRDLKWDLNKGPQQVRKTIEQDLPLSSDVGASRELLVHFLSVFEAVESRIADLPCGVIHNDANDHNVLVHSSDEIHDFALVGLIDFGDMMLTTQVNELAIAGAYLLLRADWQARILELIRGYHSKRPLSENELSVLFPLMTMRLCQSVCIAADQRRQCPDNKYLSVTEKPAWSALQHLAKFSPASIHQSLSDACFGEHQPKVESLHPIHRRRNKFVAPSLSLSYQSPLHIVRGRGQYLYDAEDVTYLDCVNNVCHVGHSHPAVVDAAYQQMLQLNTNTRYLHANLVNYAKRLIDKFPDPLEVCFFVNSGSEANDLALRLAQAKTGGTDTVVVDHAYHGHTSALIDLSPYKFNGSGGQGKRDHVHVVPMPDGYRGLFRKENADWNEQFAQAAVNVIQAAVKAGRSINAFFAESWLGCGGQVPLPPGYLKTIYDIVRAAGGVCVADEVQIGFGRVGSHFWGFESQEVVPDIVTMGKPIGNGHPLAAVVTTREIADAFHNGMEYFNTFGGNPVSCAVGLAVLDVIESENLQQHAWQIGLQLQAGLTELKERYQFIGDVRGSGLFWGIEIVRDKESRLPAARLARELVESMKKRRILLSTDGPDHNVIKFKPPMVFSAGDADRLLMTLGEIAKKVKP